MDQRTRKLMTIHKALHVRQNVDRLYVPRKEGGRRHPIIKDSVDISIWRLEDFIKRAKKGWLLLLYIDLRPGQTCRSKVMHQKEVTHSDGSYGKKSRRQAWLTWDKVKSHASVIDWCTGREWPVNCMTVISTRWQSNMPFQGQRKWHIPMASHGEILSGRLNYYITRWRQEVS